MNDQTISGIPIISLSDGKKISGNEALAINRNTARRLRNEGFFRSFLLGLTALTVLSLGFILMNIFTSGYEHLSWNFLESFPSRFAHKAGILPALLGTLWIISIAMVIAIPVSIGAAIYLEELMPQSKFKAMVDTNIANLAGVPSIVYGILGLVVFVRFMNFERSILSGSMTLALLVMPIVITACREALAAVPFSIKQSAMCLGASKIQTTLHHTLPCAMPGILSGIILAVSRIVGETAPLLIVGAASYITYVPESPMDGFSALPIQIYNWAARPQEEFHDLAAAGIIVLLGVVFVFNIAAILIRNHYSSRNIQA